MTKEEILLTRFWSRVNNVDVKIIYAIRDGREGALS